LLPVGLTKGEDNIDYGLLEPNGKKIINNEEFAELIRTKLATNLHLKEHKVRAKEDGSIHTVNASVETKGVKGTDNRKYLLDLIRMTPRDANYLGKHNDTAILRSELLGQYAATLMADAAREKLKEKRAAKAKVEDAEKPKKDNEEEDADELADEEFDMADMPVPDLKFNTDVFVTSDSFELADEPERIAEDEAEVKKLADFLKTEVIPLYCIEYLRGVTDSQTLTQSMHQMGINMRYLGEVLNTAIVMGAQFYRDVVMREMIVRSSKYILSYILQRTKTYDTASVLAQFLNSFFGRLTDNQKGSRSGLTLGSDKVENIDIRQEFELTHNNLWARIRSVVQRKYNFQLPEHIPATIFELSTLRALCLRNGIKLEARNYDLNMEKAFTADNIVDLLPIVKHSPPASKDIMEILATARNYSMHKRLDIAHDLFQEAVNLIPLVYGPLHRDTAQCYSNLALLVFNNLQDATQAEQLMTMACLISERVLGMDHSDTAHAYANLASMCFHNQKTKQGTNYILRALYILVRVRCCVFIRVLRTHAFYHSPAPHWGI
jgi:protein TIF31